MVLYVIWGNLRPPPPRNRLVAAVWPNRRLVRVKSLDSIGTAYVECKLSQAEYSQLHDFLHGLTLRDSPLIVDGTSFKLCLGAPHPPVTVEEPWTGNESAWSQVLGRFMISLTGDGPKPLLESPPWLEYPPSDWCP